MNYTDTKKDKTYLGECLKERRINLNVTKSRVKVLSGLRYDTITAIENGNTEYTIDSLLLYLSAIKKIKELKAMKLNRNTEIQIVFSDSFSVFTNNENNLEI